MSQIKQLSRVGDYRFAQLRRKFFAVAVLVFSIACLQVCAVAQDESRPKSEKLLPESTVVYLQVKNIRELVEKLNDSSIGQMLADEKIAPLAQEMYLSLIHI